jgi:hypothetical protein
MFSRPVWHLRAHEPVPNIYEKCRFWNLSGFGELAECETYRRTPCAISYLLLPR